MKDGHCPEVYDRLAAVEQVNAHEIKRVDDLEFVMKSLARRVAWLTFAGVMLTASVLLMVLR